MIAACKCKKNAVVLGEEHLIARLNSNIIGSEVPMKPLRRQAKIERPKKEKLTREETLKRVKAFAKRKEKLIAAIREGSH